MNKKLALLTAAAACVMGIFAAPSAPQAAVEYVRICSLYGVGYFYIPGTDTCLNIRTGETRRATEAGLWSALLTRTPGYWVKNALLNCSGRIRTIGAFGVNNLTLNPSIPVYETSLIPFNLGRKEFISGLYMKGAFAAPAVGFCVSIRDSQGTSLVLGCQDQSLMQNTPATWKMIPVRSTPPATMVAPFYFVGGNADALWSGLPSSGSVTLSACVENAP